MKIELRIVEGEWQATEGAAGLEAFVHELEQCVNVMWNKNALYGSSWRKQGWMGNLARVMGKTDRLRTMLWGEFTLQNTEETVEDTLRDLINLSVFMLRNLAQENRWGQ